MGTTANCRSSMVHLMRAHTIFRCSIYPLFSVVAATTPTKRSVRDKFNENDTCIESLIEHKIYDENRCVIVYCVMHADGCGGMDDAIHWMPFKTTVIIRYIGECMQTQNKCTNVTRLHWILIRPNHTHNQLINLVCRRRRRWPHAPWQIHTRLRAFNMA